MAGASLDRDGRAARILKKDKEVPLKLNIIMSEISKSKSMSDRNSDWKSDRNLLAPAPHVLIAILIHPAAGTVGLQN